MISTERPSAGSVFLKTFPEALTWLLLRLRRLRLVEYPFFVRSVQGARDVHPETRFSET